MPDPFAFMLMPLILRHYDYVRLLAGDCFSLPLPLLKTRGADARARYAATQARSPRAAVAIASPMPVMLLLSADAYA